MLNSKRYWQRGVSLIEVLVALFILSVVGVAILGAVYVNVKSTGAAREGIRAEGLAKYELEYVKGCANSNWKSTSGWSYTLEGGPPSVGASTPWDTNHTIPPGYEGYSIKVSSTLLSVSPYSNDTNIQKVTAAVSYVGSTVLSIDTYIVNNQ